MTGIMDRRPIETEYMKITIKRKHHSRETHP